MEPWLLVGLGNVGLRYQFTRHNAGFWWVDWLAKRFNLHFKKNTHLECELASFHYQSHKIIVAKPTTLMNASGRCVRKLVDYYGIKPSQTLIIQDELDLPAGKYRLKRVGSSAGHNGIKDIMKHLGSETDWVRLRLGINQADKDPATISKLQNVHSFVLKMPSRQDKKLITSGFETCWQALDYWFCDGGDLNRATQFLHS